MRCYWATHIYLTLWRALRKCTLFYVSIAIVCVCAVLCKIKLLLHFRFKCYFTNSWIMQFGCNIVSNANPQDTHTHIKRFPIHFDRFSAAESQIRVRPGDRWNFTRTETINGTNVRNFSFCLRPDSRKKVTWMWSATYILTKHRTRAVSAITIKKKSFFLLFSFVHFESGLLLRMFCVSNKSATPIWIRNTQRLCKLV